MDFEGRRVEVRAGDTVASALYRAGVRTFTRSLKYHRRRGLYCLTGDCPNCLVNVNGEPGVRACTCEAVEGQRVRRQAGFPSTEHDLLAVLDRLHALMPVGFYYKVFGKPRWVWPFAERIIRRATGVGKLPLRRAPALKPSVHVRADVLVIGGGAAGLAAARAAASTGGHVVLVDEGRVGDPIAPGPALDRIRELAEELRALPNVELFERHAAIGLYEGPLVPANGPDALLLIRAEGIVVATGAVETHGVFPGNDLPGVWLGRAAARMAGVHGVAPARRAVVVAHTVEGVGNVATLRAAGVEVVLAVVPSELAGLVPRGVAIVPDGRVRSVLGRRHVTAVVLDTGHGDRRVDCDAVVLSLGFAPRDGLLRMGYDLPVTGAGEVALPGCTLDEALDSGARAGAAEPVEPREPPDEPLGRSGTVCLCEDVGVRDLERAWAEGWTSSEILKRYTTATMGPCQGAMCGRYLSAFARARTPPPDAQAGARTTSRPPVRPTKLEDLAGGVAEVIPKRTALHDTHVRAGAHVDWSGGWMRPYRYGDPAEEYRAVRERVSVMDVGTLGTFLVGGRDATALLDRVFPCRVTDLEPGRSRYTVVLDEAGYVFDDGLVCALGDERYVVTSTSGGADRMEAWLRNWADRLDLHAHVVNQTAMLGAINVAGPLARELLVRLTADDVDADSLPISSHRAITVAGVPCRAIRSGFVGELSFELHHARSRGPELWDALLREGADLGIRPHGLDALDVLRLEKGHVYLGQDTLPDDHPAKLGLGWTVPADKPAFVGRAALERMTAFPLERKLVGLRFDSDPQRGAPLLVDGTVAGRITSCARSAALGHSIGLGWIRARDGVFATTLTSDGATATVVPTPFYDPEGARLRA
ncbi:MAG TPA: 2Fe-2S iron-sulfur cluster-binding protein [Actinomycetota bacterium]|nr:2Fe-2S iron-sulfur cluster-binding protein [Actinomycetota bacterium]